jgi:signal transduction histidine kinase
MGAPRLTGETLHAEEDWFIRPDGTFYPISWWAAPIDLPSGRGVVASFTDITEQRNLERAARERDAAEIRAALSRASRRRLVDSLAAANRSTARNLHDGAQQRLIALSLELSLLEDSLGGDPDATKRLDQARQEIALSLEELRDVARGIHPAVLSGHGLEVALESIAACASVPVRLRVELEGRPHEQLEVVVYYVVSESLANVAKHARATRATVDVARENGQMVVEVVDDGVGGADTERGSGLRGLADRVEAVGGRLRIWTPLGGGTRVKAEIPCA